MVIRTAVQDAHGTVELFDEDKTNHLVREGHLAERELLVGGCIDGR